MLTTMVMDFGYLDFANTLTIMIIGFGVKSKYCLGLTNLKKFEIQR
jgi:hypothetical protein